MVWCRQTLPGHSLGADLQLPLPLRLLQPIVHVRHGLLQLAPARPVVIPRLACGGPAQRSWAVAGKYFRLHRTVLTKAEKRGPRPFVSLEFKHFCVLYFLGEPRDDLMFSFIPIPKGVECSKK